MEKQIEKPKNNFKKKMFCYLLAASLTLLPLKLKSDETYIPKNLYRYNPYSENLFSNDPFWTHRVRDVCNTHFSTYVNKKNEIVPILFVAYNDGRAGVFILPMKSEKEMFYYEFEKKFEIQDFNVCHIFDGVEEYKGNKIVYFRVVDKKGETVNYGVPYGMF